MNDSLTVHTLVGAQVTGAVVDATARTFPRVASRSSSDSLRQSLHVGSLSPTIIRIAHQPVKGTSETRSLFGLKQTLGRVDGTANPIGSDNIQINMTSQLDKSRVTLAEYRTAVYLWAGALLENNGALIDSQYNGEM